MSKKLFAFDLDGTLLCNSQTNEVDQATKAKLKALRDAGHYVCIFTGRPWTMTSKIYNDLNLDTVVVNCNGAHIHHPRNYNYIPHVANIPLTSVIKILESDEIKQITENTIILGIDYLQIQEKFEMAESEDMPKLEEFLNISYKIDYHKIEHDPVGIWIFVKDKYNKDLDQLCNFLNAKFGDLVDVSYWNMGEKGVILEIASHTAHKEMALIKVARYYGVDMNDTVAFGDGYNDLGMLAKAGLGVAMKNGDLAARKAADTTTEFSNENAGIARFLEWYLDKGNYKKKVKKYIFKK